MNSLLSCFVSCPSNNIIRWLSYLLSANTTTRHISATESLFRSSYLRSYPCKSYYVLFWLCSLSLYYFNLNVRFNILSLLRPIAHPIEFNSQIIIWLTETNTFLVSSFNSYWCFRPRFWSLQSRKDTRTLSNIFTVLWRATSAKSVGMTTKATLMKTTSLIPIMPFHTGSKITIRAIIMVKRSTGTVGLRSLNGD